MIRTEVASVIAWRPFTKTLHWLSEPLLAAMLAGGFLMASLARAAEATGDYSATLLGLSLFEAFQLHKLVGVLLLVVTLLRLAGRRIHPAPRHAGSPQVAQKAAAAAHFALYMLMLSLPLSGWMLASSSPRGILTIVFDLIPLAHPIGPDAPRALIWSWAHFAGGLSLALLASLHVAATLKHHFLNRDAVLSATPPRAGRPGGTT